MESRSANAERHRQLAASARRREAVLALRAVEVSARYGASVLSNGATPAEAVQTAREVAAELNAAAGALARLTRPGSLAERKQLVAQLARFGWPRARIAEHTGLSERTVYRILRPGRPAGDSDAADRPAATVRSSR